MVLPAGSAMQISRTGDLDYDMLHCGAWRQRLHFKIIIIIILIEKH